MIIVEGTDGVGKTTLCKKIANKLHLKYVKIPRHTGDPEVDGFKFYMQQVEELPVACVVDRFHLGEYVYPRLYKNDLREPLTIWQLHAIERTLMARGAMLIYVSAKPEWIIENKLQRGENCVDLFLEQELFAQCVSSSLLFTKHYLPDLYHNDNVFLDFLTKHEQIKRQLAIDRFSYLSTGSIQNPIVLVGDQVKPKYNTKLAFNAWAGGSAYLHEALSIAGFNYNWYLTNSAGKTPETLRTEIASLQPLKVIALGTKATACLQDALIPHVNFEHPTHHKRFNHNVYNYAHKLQDLVW